MEKRLEKIALDNFVNRFSNKKLTDDIELREIKKDIDIDKIDIITLLTKSLKAVSSSSEVRRLVKQNAIKVNGKTVNSIDFQCVNNTEFHIQVGKKIAFRVIID
jgi:tyrosyl-tRNA synthetase